jgi:hypothetical protein
MGGAIEPSNDPKSEAEEAATMEALPKEAGVFLLLIGLGGLVLPGPIGTPFLILSAAVFFPKLFNKVDQQIVKRFPESHRQGMKQVHRFVSDLERRYPSRA